MKKTLFFCAWLALAAQLSAVTPAPYTVGVNFTTKQWGYDGPTDGATMTFYDETGGISAAPSAAPSTGGESNPIKTAWVRPGKAYTVHIDGWKLWQYALSFTAPEGYAIYIDGDSTDLVMRSVPSPDWFYANFTFELRPLASVAPLGAGVFSGIDLGGSVTWEVGLGGLRSGSAGRVIFKERDLSVPTAVASRARLYYQPPASISQITVVKDGPSNQTLRQIMVPQALVDFVDDTNGYWIKFYAPASGTWNGSSYTVSGTPWRTLRVESYAANQLKVTETEGSVSRVSQLDLTSSSSPAAAGGTVTTSGGYTIHTFTSNGTFTVSAPLTAEVLVVGGGGGATGGVWGQYYGSGGAGGTVAYNGALGLSAGNYGVTIGAGGAASGAVANGADGGNTVFGSLITATGGQGSRGASGGSNASYSAGPAPASPSSSGGAGGGGNGGSQGGGLGYYSAISGAGLYYAGGGGGAETGTSYAGGPGGGGTGANGQGTSGSYYGAGGGGSNSNFPGGSGYQGIVVVRYLNVVGIASGNYQWTLKEGDGTNWLRTTVQTSSVVTGGRNAITEVRTGGATGTIVSKTKHYFEPQAWGEELMQIVADPDGDALTTTFSYYTNSGEFGNYRRVKSVTQPTGNWTGYRYFDDWDRRARVQYEFHPWVDTPGTVNTTDITQGRVMIYDYALDWTGRTCLPAWREERVNNERTALNVSIYDHTRVVNGLNAVVSFNYAYQNSGSYVYSEIQKVREWASNPDFAGLVLHNKSADQSQFCAIRTYVNYDPLTKTWSGGSTDYTYEATFHGSHSGAVGTYTDTAGGLAMSSGIYLVPNKSTMDIVIRDKAGLVLRTEKRVYAGGTFTLLSSEDFTYDVAGRLTSRVASNGATTEYHYTDGRLDYTIGVDGTRTEFTYDVLGRVATSIKIGGSYGSYTLPGNITTTSTYDGANRVTQSVTSGGSLTLTSSAVFDLAGRTTSSTAPGFYTTSYAYSSGGKVVTATLPGGGTQTTTSYLDGSAKEISGTAVVYQYVTYGIDSGTGKKLSQTTVGGVASAWTNTYTDWLGRKIEEWKPGWNGNAVYRIWTYSTAGQLVKYARTGFADTLYTYNTLGQLWWEGLDIDGNGALDGGGDDRITFQDSFIHTWDGGATWWLGHNEGVFTTSASWTTHYTRQSNDLLSGFPANRLSWKLVNDNFGNTTAICVDVDRSAKTLTTTTDTPDSNVNAVQVAYNGLPVSSTSTTNLTTTCGYDALGRQTTSVDPRRGTTTTAYKSGSNQVDWIKDPANIAQATYTYDSAGRVATLTDALGKVARYEYNPRGQKTHEWGDTTYPVEYVYDNSGRQTQMKTFRAGSGWTDTAWPSGTTGTADVTTWTFNQPTGLLESKTDASSQSVSYTYTQAGQIATRTWARGTVTTYGYSPTTGELLTVDYSDTTPDLTYTYNRLGQQATVTDVTGTRTFNYNLAGTLELQREVLPSGFYGDWVITRGYDSATGVVGRYNRLIIGTYVSVRWRSS